MSRTIWIGFDPREADAYMVAKASFIRHTQPQVPIYGLLLSDLRERGLYTRPTIRKGGKLWDVISEAPMSTEFSISRFLTPILSKFGWALFTDCDVMARAPLMELFHFVEKYENQKYALFCVKHRHEPKNITKMDGQAQTKYPRKNWSSIMLFNCGHLSNKRLTLDMVNKLPGRDLHAFCWLKDDEIGELGPEWNYLVGNMCKLIEPKIVHWTDGVPTMPGYENVQFADEYRERLKQAL